MNNISRTFEGYKVLNLETGEITYLPDVVTAIKRCCEQNYKVVEAKFKAIMSISDFVEHANIVEIDSEHSTMFNKEEK